MREREGIQICGCQCNERLKAISDGSKCLTYNGLSGDLENLKIETRFIGESFANGHIAAPPEMRGLGEPLCCRFTDKDPSGSEYSLGRR